MQAMAAKEAAKSKIAGILDPLRYKEEDDPDGTKLKANVIGRYLAIAACAVMLLTGVIGVGMGGVCAFSGAFTFLVFYPITNLELYHYVLPTESPTDEGEAEAAAEQEAESKEEDEDDSDDEEEEKKPGCCAKCCSKCCHRLRKCCFFCILKWPGPRHMYENFYIRAAVYIVLSIPLWLCGITMAAGLFLVATGLTYAFARWRGEKERTLDTPEDPPEEPEGDKEEPKEDEEEAPKKGRRKKKK